MNQFFMNPAGQTQFGFKLKKMKRHHRKKLQDRKKRKWNADDSHPQGRKPAGKKLAPSITLVTGHSFADRLRTTLNKISRARRQPWRQILNLEGVKVEPMASGFGGAYINDFWRMEDYIDDCRPDAVILELGGNDLCFGETLEETAKKLVEKCRKCLENRPWLKELIWCQLIPRRKIYSRYKDTEQYNEDVVKFNKIVREMIRGIARLHHWKHGGFQKPTTEVLKDGTHPTTAKLGTTRYLASIGRLCRWTKVNQPPPSSSEEEKEEEEPEADQE